MRTLLRDLRDLLVSLKFTVALIALSIVLVLAATLDQVNIGVWAVQAKYFYTFAVWWPVGRVSLAVFPGGYTLGGLLLANLVAAFIYRFKPSARKSGTYLVHLGFILLLAGQFFTGLMQDEYQMRLDEGVATSYAESYRNVELAITDITDPKFDEVVAIPESLLARQETVQHPRFPFRVAIKSYLPNSTLQMRSSDPAAAPSPANQGIGPEIVALPQPVATRTDARDLPSAFVELDGPDGPIGTWLVSVMLETPQRFDFAGRSWKIALRFARRYQPFSLTLLHFSHDRYAGTDIPKNFSSRVRIATADGRENREVLIYMNNPLRYGGLTFYQAGFENNDRTSVLQVVRNPSWLLPYISCSVMALGLVIQFGLHLVGFVARRRPSAHADAAAPAANGPRPSRGGRLVPLLAGGAALAGVVASMLPPRQSGDYDLAAFGRLPTLVDGRIKPLDTVARSTLLVLQG
ncbi:MAG TPA: cytochrome c biogenesis protein ResB, partial [Opitutus sp.]|nr:cytochrome c biogenesis protein ResB [Opitutus sp.]